MTEPKIVEFEAAGKGERLDKLLVAHFGDELTRSQIKGLIKDGRITVNGGPFKPGVRLKGGERIRVEMPEPREDVNVAPEPIELNILYEDDVLALIEKPAGLVVHPGAGNETGTLVNALLDRFPEISQITYAAKRRGIVHRLDKDTSGLILTAKNARAMHRLMSQFQARTVEKVYLALVEKAPRTNIGRIEVPLGRDPVQRRKMAVTRHGRPAISEFEVLEQFPSGQALVRVKLLTGRTHQVRVHMAFVNAPLVGDQLYGRKRQRIRISRQFLHAHKLCFDHPMTGERMCFESPLPPDLTAVLDELRAGKEVTHES